MATQQVESDCGICLSLVVMNLQCPQCEKLFCSSCLQNWMKNATSCPSCRLESDLSKFTHNAELQAEYDMRIVRCDYCEVSYKWRDRSEHLEVCEKAHVHCPFEGCDFIGPENVVDVHTMTCSFSQQYTMNGASIKQEDVPEKYQNLLRDLISSPDETEDSGESSTLIHYIQDGDTIAGLCIKYDCSVTEIRRLNRLVGDSLFAHVKLIVPRPKDWDKRHERSHVPVEALIALRKRRLTNEMMAKTGLSAEESVAYLHVVDYNLKAALDKYQSDQKWAEDNDYSKPSNFKEFLKQRAYRSQDFDGARGGGGVVAPIKSINKRIR